MLSLLLLPVVPAQAMPGAGAAFRAAGKPHCPTAQFGAAVAISGGTAVIGAPTALKGGAVCIFARSTGRWRLQAVLADPPHGKYDGFGSVVAVSATAKTTHILVGATGNGDNGGTVQPDGPVYAYARSGTSWHRTQTLPDPAGYHPGNWFGLAMAMSGGSAVITTQGVGKISQAAYFYALSGRSWQLQATLKTPSGYGGVAAISGATALVGLGGRPGVPGSTASARLRPRAADGYPEAEVYVRSGSRWHLQAHIADYSNDKIDNEPTVAVSGKIALLGGIYVPGFGGGDKGADRGHVYVFRHTGSTWRRIETINDPGKSHGDFSTGMSVSGGTAVVGAPDAQDGCGVAYVYRWYRQKYALRTKLVPPGGSKCGKRGYFGWAVAVSGKTSIIGAPGTGKTYVLSIP